MEREEGRGGAERDTDISAVEHDGLGRSGTERVQVYSDRLHPPPSTLFPPLLIAAVKMSEAVPTYYII